MSAIRLYELTDEYQSLFDNLADSETGEINQEAVDRLNALEKPIQDKCINTVRAMKDMEAEAKAIEAERKAMQAREKAIKARIEWVKGYLLENMEKCAITKINCPQFEISLRKNPESVEVYEESSIPLIYKRVKYEDDLTLLKTTIKSGIDVPGARLVQKSSVRIK